MDRDRILGVYDAYADVLAYLNTLDTKVVEKKDIYAAVMAMRPAPQTGHKLVPVDPTPAMLSAANNDWQTRVRDKIAGKRPFADPERAFTETYHAMIGAAP